MARKLIMLLICYVVLTCTGFAQTVELPQTGQIACYDSAGNMVACLDTGQDGDVRAGVAWPGPRLAVTYCDENGPCTDQEADCDGDPATDVIKDNLTNLMWSRKARDGGTWGVLYWQDAINGAAGLSLCGYDDWYLPNINQIETLVNW